VIVSAPRQPDEFDHHPRFQQLIDSGAVVLVPGGADDDAYADQIISALQRPAAQTTFDFDGWWRDVAQAVQAQLRVNPAPGIVPDNAARISRPGT
jgi:hypothetical protein